MLARVKEACVRDLENLKPLYTNKKVQLQLDFFISPAVAGLFY